MKNLILFCFCFTTFISFAQETIDSIEFTILSETKNIYVQSDNFEGVVFVWDENDSLNWTLSEDDVIKTEFFFKNLFNSGLFNMGYFVEMKYSEFSEYKRQYIGKYYVGTKKKYLCTCFLKNETSLVQSKKCLEKPRYIIGGEPLFLFMCLDFDAIINNDYKNWSKYYH